jgi:hypothetical protein
MFPLIILFSGFNNAAVLASTAPAGITVEPLLPLLTLLLSNYTYYWKCDVALSVLQVPPLARKAANPLWLHPCKLLDKGAGNREAAPPS